MLPGRSVAPSRGDLETIRIKLPRDACPWVRLGRVDIAWTVDEPAQRLRLTWTEKNGPAVQPPARQSFGTRLIETLSRQLKGNVRLTYEPGGFVYAFDVPLASLMPAAAE